MGFNRLPSVTGNLPEVERAAARVLRKNARHAGDVHVLMEHCGLSYYEHAVIGPFGAWWRLLTWLLGGQLRVNGLRPGQPERGVPGQDVKDDRLLDLVVLVVVAAARAGGAAGFPHVVRGR